MSDALLLFTAVGQRFTRLKTILADQGCNGVDFLATGKANYQSTVDVVGGVLGIKGFQVGRRGGGAQAMDCRANIWLVGLSLSSS